MATDASPFRDRRRGVELEIGGGRLEPPRSMHPDGRLVTMLGPSEEEGPDASSVRRYLVVNWLRWLTEIMEESP